MYLHTNLQNVKLFLDTVMIKVQPLQSLCGRDSRPRSLLCNSWLIGDAKCSYESLEMCVSGALRFFLSDLLPLKTWLLQLQGIQVSVSESVMSEKICGNTEKALSFPQRHNKISSVRYLLKMNNQFLY